MAIHWEYMTAAMPAELNELGKDGWELVTILPAEGKAGPTAYFKRVKPEKTSGNSSPLGFRGAV